MFSQRNRQIKMSKLFSYSSLVRSFTQMYFR